MDKKELAQIPDNQTYDAKPVENYGLQLLKSMGFTQQRGIGKNPQNALIQPLVLKPRPRGLGLGAEQQNQTKKPEFSKGDLVLIIEGPHKDLLALVKIFAEEEIQLQLKKSGSIIKVPISQIKKITSQQAKSLQKNDNQQKKKKHLKWMVPNIRLKVIDKTSNFYLKKVIVTQVPSAKQFQCLYKDEQGQKIYIRDLRQKDVQTVLPKIGETAIIVRGSYSGQKCTLMQRDKKRQKVTVQTLSELELVTLQEDDIAEYVEF